MVPSKKTGIRKRTEGFTEQLRAYLFLCSRIRFEGHQRDTFLWNARRCLEAMLRALLTPYPPRDFEELSIEALLKDAVQRTIIPYEIAPTFEALERSSRVGARVQDSRIPDLAEVVDRCSEQLVRAVTWFFETATPARSIPDGVRAALTVLKTTEKKPTKGELAAKKRGRLVEELHDAVADRATVFSSLREQALALVDQIDAEKNAADQSRDTLEGLKSELLTTLESPQEPGRMARSPSRIRLLAVGLAAGIIGIFAGIALASIFGGPQEEPSPPQPTQLESEAQPSPMATTETIDAAPRTPVRDASVLPPVDPPAVENEEVELSEDGVLSCPRGMVSFDRLKVRVIQPFPRKNWPPGPKVLPYQEVPPFCMDREPVLVSEYQECVAVNACPRRRGCQGHPTNYPVNCVTWADADTYCRWRKGSLPNIMQWERSLLSSKIRLEPARGTWEWVMDPFPAPVLQRGPVKLEEDGSVWGYMALQKLFQPRGRNRKHCSWHKAPAGTSRGNLSFRCVINPSEI